MRRAAKARETRSAIVRRRAAGWAWLGGWILVLYLVAAPWRELGGIVDERVRWLEAVALPMSVLIGFTVGRWGRERALEGGGTHLALLRRVRYPAAGLTAAGLIALAAIGERGPAGVLFTALLAYWAGLDLAFGAVPLMEGRSYRFARPLDPEPPDSEPAQVPPWGLP